MFGKKNLKMLCFEQAPKIMKQRIDKKGNLGNVVSKDFM